MLIAPLERLGYSIAAEPSGKPILVFARPDGARLGATNTESFYFAAQDTAVELDTGLLIKVTATWPFPLGSPSRADEASWQTC